MTNGYSKEIMINFKKFNIADWFSFYRILASPLLLFFLILENRDIFKWLLLVSFCTDMIDGFLARKLQITSSRGSQLDSVGDQVTFVMGLAGLAVFEFDFIKANYLVILIVFALYMLQMLIAYMKYGKATAFHTYMAKLSAILQGVFILWALFFGPVYWLFYVVVILGFLETIEEITLIFLYKKWTSDVKGIYWALKDKRQ